MRRQEVRTKLNNFILGEYDFDAFYAFVKGLMDKGMTAEEVKGFIDSIQDRAVGLRPSLDPNAKTIDVSGTGGDTVKTINVGSIVSLVLATGGLVVGKQATRAYTSTM